MRLPRRVADRPPVVPIASATPPGRLVGEILDAALRLPDGVVLEVERSDSPALVGIGNVLLMFWKGVGGDANTNTYWSSVTSDAANGSIVPPGAFECERPSR